MEDLITVRDKWFDAYLKGDIETLQAIELPDFTFVSERGEETGVGRYTKIAAKMKAGIWFNPCANKRDIEIEYRHVHPTCFVSGFGEITTNGRLIRRVNFAEVWVASNDCWRIQSLHTTQVSQR